MPTKRKPKPPEREGLKPCPFCGKKLHAVQHVNGKWYITHKPQSCLCDYKTERLAIQAGNRRAKGAKRAK